MPSHASFVMSTVLPSQAPTNVSLKTVVAQESLGFQPINANKLFEKGAQRFFFYHGESI